MPLQILYGEFDGMTLFSSTFKVAAIEAPRALGGVPVVPSLKQLNSYAREDGAQFPEDVLPFMMQAGRGFYGVDPGGSVYLWDQDDSEVRLIEGGVLEVFESWCRNVLDTEE